MAGLKRKSPKHNMKPTLQQQRPDQKAGQKMDQKPLSQQQTPLETRFLDAFNTLQATTQNSAQNSTWLSQWRQQHFAQFLSQGIPTQKSEHWKYTNIRALLENTAIAPLKDNNNTLIPAVLRLPLQADHLLVTVNGRFIPALSEHTDIAGVRLHDAADNPAVFEKYLGTICNSTLHPIAAINAGLCDKPLIVEITANTKIDKLIHIVHMVDPDNAPGSSYPRLLLMMAADAQATVMEHFIAVESSHHHTTNALTEIHLSDNSHLNYLRLNREGPASTHIGGVHVRQNQRSHFDAFTFNYEGQVIRNDLHVNLAGQGAQTTLNGLYFCRQKSHMDNAIHIEHNTTDGVSYCNYKGIATDKAHGVFSGLITIHRHAQNSQAHLHNKNLLLSASAQIDTKPVLEIYADQVQASHGSAVSQLDPEHLFYLQSRGIDAHSARDILNYAFLNERIATIAAEPIRAYFNQLLLKQFQNHQVSYEFTH